MLRDFNLKVKVHKPRVNYRETIERPVELAGECHRQIGGQQLFARLRVRMEPFAGAAQPVTIVNRCPPDTLPTECLQSRTGRAEITRRGGRSTWGGFPLMKLKVTVLGGETAEEGSTDVAFRIAAGDAFEKGFA